VTDRSIHDRYILWERIRRWVAHLIHLTSIRSASDQRFPYGSRLTLDSSRLAERDNEQASPAATCQGLNGGSKLYIRNPSVFHSPAHPIYLGGSISGFGSISGLQQQTLIVNVAFVMRLR